MKRTCTLTVEKVTMSTLIRIFCFYLLCCFLIKPLPNDLDWCNCKCCPLNGCFLASSRTEGNVGSQRCWKTRTGILLNQYCSLNKSISSKNIFMFNSYHLSFLFTWIWDYQPRSNSVYSHSCAGALKSQQKKKSNSVKVNIKNWNKDNTYWEISPKLEILFEDKLSTARYRRDARGAKFEILFPERSSLSKFIHSPIHPRSCVPVRRAINNIKKSTRISWLKSWHIYKILPRPLSLRKSIDSRSNSPVRDLSSTAVILSQSVSAQIGETGRRAKQGSFTCLFLNTQHTLLLSLWVNTANVACLGAPCRFCLRWNNQITHAMVL